MHLRSAAAIEHTHPPGTPTGGVVHGWIREAGRAYLLTLLAYLYSAHGGCSPNLCSLVSGPGTQKKKQKEVSKHSGASHSVPLSLPTTSYCIPCDRCACDKALAGVLGWLHTLCFVLGTSRHDIARAEPCSTLVYLSDVHAPHNRCPQSTPRTSSDASKAHPSSAPCASATLLPGKSAGIMPFAACFARTQWHGRRRSTAATPLLPPSPMSMPAMG